MPPAATLSSIACHLGEGPVYEAGTDSLWWFDILGKTLHGLQIGSGAQEQHALPMMASVVARIDDERQLLATEHGLFIRQRAGGDLALYCELEPDKTANRSNDGRVHPCGSLWIGTMAKDAEAGAGAIYHVAGGKATKLFADLGIPNSICFSPDGATGYFVDTQVNRLMRVPLDPATGLPAGEASVLVDTSSRAGSMDGSVCDSDGHIWNARWGAGAIDQYAADGRHLQSLAVPTRQVSCPAFFGAQRDRLAVTSAWEGMSDEERSADPAAGMVFSLETEARGLPEADFQP